MTMQVNEHGIPLVIGRAYPTTNGYGQLIQPSQITHCSGQTHVFACEHAEKCKCGKASRTPEPRMCGVCGK